MFGVPDTHSATRAVTADKLRKIRILVVDDEEDILLILKRTLETHDFEVDAFRDPKKALSNFKASYYDLLILDIRMPGMDGFELYSEIRKRDSKVKVCFLTAFETYREELRRLYPELKEVKCYIQKPVSTDDLLRQIQAILGFT